MNWWVANFTWKKAECLLDCDTREDNPRASLAHAARWAIMRVMPPSPASCLTWNPLDSSAPIEPSGGKPQLLIGADTLSPSGAIALME